MAEGDDRDVEIQMDTGTELKQLEAELQNLGASFRSLKEARGRDDEKVVGTGPPQNVDKIIDDHVIVTFLEDNLGLVEAMVAKQIALDGNLPRFTKKFDVELEQKSSSCPELKETFELFQPCSQKLKERQNEILVEMKENIEGFKKVYNQTQGLEKRAREIAMQLSQLTQALEIQISEDNATSMTDDLETLKINVVNLLRLKDAVKYVELLKTGVQSFERVRELEVKLAKDKIRFQQLVYKLEKIKEDGLSKDGNKSQW